MQVAQRRIDRLFERRRLRRQRLHRLPHIRDLFAAIGRPDTLGVMLGVGRRWRRFGQPYEIFHITDRIQLFSLDQAVAHQH